MTVLVSSEIRSAGIARFLSHSLLTLSLLSLRHFSRSRLSHLQSKKAKASAEGDDVKVEKVEISYGPKGVKSGEQVFGIAHIYASFNDTFVVREMKRSNPCSAVVE